MSAEPPSAVVAVGLDHLVLRVADVERALAFYTAVLGGTPERVDLWRSGSVPFPSVRFGSGLVDLVPGAEGGGPGRNLDHLCLEVGDADLEAAARALRSRGVEVLGPPQTRWGARGDGPSLYIRDPDGTTVELKAYPG